MYPSFPHSCRVWRKTSETALSTDKRDRVGFNFRPKPVNGLVARSNSSTIDSPKGDDQGRSAPSAAEALPGFSRDLKTMGWSTMMLIAHTGAGSKTRNPLGGEGDRTEDYYTGGACQIALPAYPHCALMGIPTSMFISSTNILYSQYYFFRNDKVSFDSTSVWNTPQYKSVFYKI